MPRNCIAHILNFTTIHADFEYLSPKLSMNEIYIVEK
jgi:hypothetical protein